jgi:hypothetical protein
MYYWGHGKLGRCVIQLSKFLNHTLATHNQVDSFFENISYNDGKGAFTLTLFEMTITDCPGFHVPHCTYFVFGAFCIRRLRFGLQSVDFFRAFSVP